ncbi:MAG TPA: hypothetical protein VIX37_08980 [Candidatus Sulfotelmatobacter sp.]
MPPAGAGSTSLQDCFESARHVLRYFEDDDLRGPSGFGAVGNAEEVK